MHHLAALDELQLGERHDAAAVERGLEGEVEPGQGFQRRQPGHQQRRLDPAVLPQRQLLGEQGVDRLQRGDLAALELADDRVDGLQRARHAQCDQRGLDVLGERWRERRLRGHHADPFTAITRPSAS